MKVVCDRGICGRGVCVTWVIRGVREEEDKGLV